MLPIYLFLSVDLDAQKSMRDTLMHMFFDKIGPSGIREISTHQHGSSPNDICSGWKGITCMLTEVHGIRYSNMNVGNFNIECLPHSTKSIQIIYCYQNFILVTRTLPMHLGVLTLANNYITGQLDLTQLPQNPQLADFRNNCLSGPIILTRLPKSLKKLIISPNPIKQRTVWYDDLPPNIEEIRLSIGDNSMSLLDVPNKTQIEEVRSISPKEAVQNKNIFQGLREKQIH